MLLCQARNASELGTLIPLKRQGIMPTLGHDSGIPVYMCIGTLRDMLIILSMTLRAALANPPCSITTISLSVKSKAIGRKFHSDRILLQISEDQKPSEIYIPSMTEPKRGFVNDTGLGIQI